LGPDARKNISIHRKRRDERAYICHQTLSGDDNSWHTTHKREAIVRQALDEINRERTEPMH